MYTIRDREGTMIAKITQQALDRILRSAAGVRKVKHFSNQKDLMCFILKEDGIYDMTNVKLYLWEGSYIELYEV